MTCDPSTLSAFGGSRVIIYGQFLGTQPPITVTFDGTPAVGKVQVINQDTIWCVTPAMSAGPVADLQVTNEWGTGDVANALTFV